MNYASILGFDYGEKRIGVSVGQSITHTARPLRNIHVVNGRPDWESITGLIEDWAPEALLVGMPIYADGAEHELEPKITRFCRQLSGRYRLPVFTIDELLSTVEARQRLQDYPHMPVDAVAAQVILESWLLQQSAQTHGQ